MRHPWQGNNGLFGSFTSEAWYDAARKVTIAALANGSAASDPAAVIWLGVSAASHPRIAKQHVVLLSRQERQLEANGRS